MTQPPLSQGLQRLERQLGVRLFERDARGVRISPAGEQLLPRALELITAADDLIEEAALVSEIPALRLGLAADLEELVPTIATTAAAFARTTGFVLQPVVSGSVELIDRLRAGQLDIAVVRHPGVTDGARPGPVLSVPTTLTDALAPDDGREARLGTVDRPVVVPPRHWQPAAHDQLVDTLRRAGHSGEVVEESDLLARRTLVATGRAVALTVAPGIGAHVVDGPWPLRLRVALPVPSARRAALDHDDVADVLTAALT